MVLASKGHTRSTDWDFVDFRMEGKSVFKWLACALGSTGVARQSCVLAWAANTVHWYTIYGRSITTSRLNAGSSRARALFFICWLRSSYRVWYVPIVVIQAVFLLLLVQRVSLKWSCAFYKETLCYTQEFFDDCRHLHNYHYTSL